MVKFNSCAAHSKKTHKKPYEKQILLKRFQLHHGTLESFRRIYSSPTRYKPEERGKQALTRSDLSCCRHKTDISL